MIERLDALLTRLLPKRAPPWWAWPAVLVLLAVGSLGAALVLQPGPDEFSYVFGNRFGAECAFQTVTGHPCPQCGMTRSFVWGARGHLIRAALYNPAGLALFLWLQAGGVVGALRLIRRDPGAAEPPFSLLFGWTMLWLVGLYGIPWLLRLWGINPLP